MSALKRAKDVTIQFGDPKRKLKILRDLQEIDRKLANVGDEVSDGVLHALAIFARSEILETTDAIKVRAATLTQTHRSQTLAQPVVDRKGSRTNFTPERGGIFKQIRCATPLWLTASRE
jgi:hypothetical protein